MELLQLIYFNDAAKTQNFSQTAHKYHVPPSNISQSIHRLETELGTSLFDRKSNKIQLNAQGKSFFEKTVKAIALLEQGRQELTDKNKISGDIRICICTNRRIVTQAIEKFKKIHKSVSFKIQHTVNSKNDFDLIVSDDAADFNKMNRSLLIREKILLAVEQDNPLVQNKLTAESLKEQSFITMHDGSSLYRYTKQICSMMGVSPDITIQTDDPFYIRKYIELGLGIAFIPSISWKGLFSEKIRLIQIGDYVRDTFVYSNGKKYMSAAVRAFLNTLIESCCFYNQTV